jgi:hypothetical protein
MPLVVKCPGCPESIELPERAVRATCPRCLTTFEAARAQPSLTPPRSDSGGDEDTAGSVGPWGVVAFLLGTLALLLASLLAVRWLTMALSAAGVSVVAVGILLSPGARQTRDRIWLGLGGSLSGVVLVLTLVAPGVINPRWTMDFAVARPDPHKQVAYHRDWPRKGGRQLGPDDWVDAVKESVLQGEVLLRLDSMQREPLEDKGPTPYLLIHFRLASSGYIDTIKFEGFSNSGHKPLLTDESGRAYAFVEQRQRKPAAERFVFEAREIQVARLRAAVADLRRKLAKRPRSAEDTRQVKEAIDAVSTCRNDLWLPLKLYRSPPNEVAVGTPMRLLKLDDLVELPADLDEVSEYPEVAPLTFLDHLLVFEAPPPEIQSLKLELPASAWGRNGTCKLRISEFFVAKLPEVEIK